MGRRLSLVALIVSLWAVTGALALRWPTPPRQTPLTTARAILSLSPQDAESQRPIHLPDAVVTSFDPEIRLIFVQDATAGVYLDSFAQPVSLRVGDRVAVQGVSARGARERMIAHARVQVLGRGPLPAPLVLLPAQYRAGVGDSPWVEVEGVLRVTRRMMNRLTLEIVRDNVRAFVLISDPGGGAKFAPGDRLRVRGVLGGGYNYKDRLIKRRVFVPSLDDITRLTEPSDDTPLVAIDRLRAEHGRSEYEAPVRIDGVVQSYTPGVSLVPEDNPVNQRLASALLAKAGYRVRVVSTGRDALQALDDEVFDVVLMDVQMPDMTGVETTRCIRQREGNAVGSAGATGASNTSARRPHVPIVAMTAHVMESDRDACLAAGMDAFLSKPLAATELLETIARLRPQAA